MSVEKEIERAVKKISSLDTESNKNDVELEDIIKNVVETVRKEEYDFSNTITMTLKQDGKKRYIKQYSDLYSTENILSQSIKQILDRSFKVRYSNRNKTTKKLFNIILAIKQMSDFTIIKFDFKDYFNSVSAIYAFEKYIKSNILDRAEQNLIADYVYQTKYAYAGLRTSNSISEIIANQFDKLVKETFLDKGIVFYERYIDDSILILNEYIDQTEVKEILNTVIKNIYHDKEFLLDNKCKTKFNKNKFCYISKRFLNFASSSLDYLGYKFDFSIAGKKVEVKYGITTQKQKKYNKKIDQFIKCYITPGTPDYDNLELLRQRIRAFTCREVYLGKKFNSNVWKVKGFISNYGELRYFLDSNLIEDSTMDFLKNMIINAFNRNGVSKPNFLNTNGYNLFDNMKTNKTILLVEHIGYDYNSLVNLCRKVGISSIDNLGHHRGYGTLVRDYLIKIKVGY
ncbi:hypothetical protein MKD14_13830 [[Clostridium] innocuum]|nr:hypothetical protein [[Clostridium] innocuum]